MAKISINLNKGTVEKQEVTKKASDVIVGIDLGTTNSLVAIMQDGNPLAVKDNNGKHTLVPSIIHFASNGTITVGNDARMMLEKEPENTIYSVKRLLGKAFQDIDQYKDYFGYKIIQEADTDRMVKVRVNDKFYTPIELSSRILAELKQRVESEIKSEVSRAVITVPAYFNDAQRQATRDAGKLAGLDVLRIVNEPTAASLAYGFGLEPSDSKTIAVYDLGGGTFDVSILRIENGIFEVLSTNGDTFLGGDDFDKAIMDYWMTSGNIDPQTLKANKHFSQALRLSAEEAKKYLSTQDNFTSKALTNYGLSEVTIDQSTFAKLVQPLVEKTITACNNALQDADLQKNQIDEVVLVGGSTRMPIVREAVSQFFEAHVNASLNPDEVVALGAAVQADILAGNNKHFLLLDITPLSLGIETVGGLMDTIIPRNSKIPTAVGRNYTTSVDGQKNLKVGVYQGERDMVADNRKLGEFVLRNIPPMPAGLPKIEIQFVLNADGILKVKAKELRSGVEQEVEVRPQYGLSEEEMGKMLMESIKHAKDDMQLRSLIESRTEANNVLLSTQKFLEQNDEMLSDSEKSSIQKLSTSLKETVEGDDKDAIQKAMDDLNDYSLPLAQKALDFHISSAMKGKKV